VTQVQVTQVQVIQVQVIQVQVTQVQDNDDFVTETVGPANFIEAFGGTTIQG
jgi:hypothetical protein